MTEELAIQLIHGYLDDTLSEEDQLRLRDWLEGSPEHAELFAELTMVHTNVQRLLEVNDLGDSIHTLLKNKNAETGQTIDVGSAIENPPARQDTQDTPPLLDLPEYQRKPAKSRKTRDTSNNAKDDDHHAVLNMLGVRVYQKTVDRTPRQGNARKYLAAALILIAVLLGLFYLNQTPADNEAFVTLAADHGLVWDEDGAQPAVGSRLAPGHYVTKEGIGEILFDRGAKVLLDGPCRFELTNDNELTLHRGKLVARITPGAAKFTVNTPQARVVDLGTEFGVEVSADGSTLAAVFEGKVDLKGHDKNQTATNNVVLSAGWQGVVDHTGSVEPAVTHIPYDHAFTRTLADSYNTLELELSGDVKWNRRAPATVRPERFHTNKFAVVFNERRNVKLAQPLGDVIREPGKYKAHELRDRMKKIKAGSVVDSYLIHFDAARAENTKVKTAHMTIKFPRPILGVIANNKAMFETDKLFKRTGTKYPLTAYGTGVRGIDKGDNADLLTIQPDGQTITLQLSGRHYDHIRVLIDSEPPGAKD